DGPAPYFDGVDPARLELEARRFGGARRDDVDLGVGRHKGHEIEMQKYVLVHEQHAVVQDVFVRRLAALGLDEYAETAGTSPALKPLYDLAVLGQLGLVRDGNARRICAQAGRQPVP